MTYELNLTAKQVANLLTISPQAVRNLERTGKLPSIRTAGGHRRFPYEDVQTYALGTLVRQAKRLGMTKYLDLSSHKR